MTLESWTCWNLHVCFNLLEPTPVFSVTRLRLAIRHAHLGAQGWVPKVGRLAYDHVGDSGHVVACGTLVT